MSKKNLPQVDSVRFTVSLSSVAVKRLKLGADQFGMGQGHVLTALLERLDWNQVAPIIEAYKKKAEARPKVSQSDILKVLAGMSPEQRAAFVARAGATPDTGAEG